MKKFTSFLVLSALFTMTSVSFAADPLFGTWTAWSASWTSTGPIPTTTSVTPSPTMGDPVIATNNNTGWVTNVTTTNTSVANNNMDVLTMDVQEDPSDSSVAVVYWTLKANNTTTIKSADIVLNYDATAFDVSASDVTAWGEWTALPLKTPNSSVQIVNWKISFSLQSATTAWFTNKPEWEYLFVVIFKKKPTFSMNNKYVFSIDGNESKVSDLNGVNLLKPVWVQISLWNGTTPTTPVVTTPISNTGTLNTANTGALNSTGALSTPNVGEAAKTETGAFENIMIALAFMMLGFAFIRKRKSV